MSTSTLSDRPQLAMYAAMFMLLLFTCPVLAAEFIPLGFLANGQNSWAAAVSDDGLVVAGDARTDDGEEMFRWTDATGMVGIGFLTGDDQSELGSGDLSPMSADGSVIVGVSHGREHPYRAFIWREGQGIEELAFRDLYEFGVSADGTVVVGMLEEVNGFKSSTIRWRLDDSEFNVVGTFPPIDNPAWANGDFTRPHGISAPDGSYIVGTGNRIEAHPSGQGFYGPRRQFMWSEENGLQQLDLEGFSSDSTTGDPYEVERISMDGSILAGQGLFAGESEYQAFRWSEDAGTIGLGWLPVPGDENVQAETYVTDMTDDGSVIIGTSRGTEPARGYIWSEQFGIEDLQDVLEDRFGLAEELRGWNLAGPKDISPNGQFIAGNGFNPNGEIEGWLVRLDRPFLATPEPSSVALLVCGYIAAGGRLRRRRTYSAEFNCTRSRRLGNG